MSINLISGGSASHLPRSHLPDARDSYGQAALLLVESLIHGLKERGVLSIAEAIDVIDTAADIQYELVDMADGAGSGLRHGAALLTVMATSLRGDAESERER